jgi:hypothetical protein
VANTQITGNIISSQITSVANTQITGNIISSQITSVANTQITGNIASSQITSNPTLYGNVSVTGVIGVGGATPSTSGAGITFPATQSASSNANTLDDYEEGTWTPVITGSISVGSCTYTAQDGTYVKIGTYVYFACDVRPSSTPTGTGILFITGLPYTAVNNQFSMSIGLPYWNGLARAFTAVGGYTDGSTTRVVMIGTLGAATGISYLAPNDMSSGARIFFAGFYQTQN